MPELNIRANLPTGRAKTVEKTVDKINQSVTGYNTILNGRFGGCPTRHYGQPKTGIHAIQMELAISTYMQEAPLWTFDIAKAAKLRLHLSNILNALEHLVQTGDLQ